MSPTRLAAILLASLCCHTAAAAPSLTEVGRDLARCAAPALAVSDIEVDSGTGGYAIDALRDRHWLELAGRARLALRDAGGREVAQVRIHQPSTGQYALQQGWREHALLDAAARGGGRVRQVDLPGSARLVTLNKATMVGKYAGVSLLSDPRRGVFVQWHWTTLDDYAGGGALAAAQQALLEPLLACLLGREAG
jgi:hypothetical protein